jgi:ribonuclease HI
MDNCMPMALPITHPPFPLSPLPLPSAGNEYLAWFDGACGPVNPGGIATYGVMIKEQDGTVLVWEHGLVGKGKAMSNNVAEYGAVLHVFRYLSTRPPGRVTIYGDSNLVINQLNGKRGISKGLYVPFALEAKALLAHLQGLGWQIDLCWIPREQNEECDQLSKKDYQTTDQPYLTGRKLPYHRPDPRNKPMLGRTIKTTGITVLRAAPSNGRDWWVCKCPCGREFTAHGWNVRHGRTRNCGSDEHNVPAREYQLPALATGEGGCAGEWNVHC